MIGLVSYHRDPNYGTMLQAYALSHAIEELGERCEYINYNTGLSRTPLERYIRHAIRTLLGLDRRAPFGFFLTKPFRGTMERFHDFHAQYIPTSSRLYFRDTIPQALACYDQFIVGSDQTWSPLINNNPYTINFLPFCPPHTPTAAYAPSFGTLHIPDNYLRTIAPLLNKFDHLSCREGQNCAPLASASGKSVTAVCDPTLLLTPHDWDKIALLPPLPHKGPYILAYILGTKPCLTRRAEQLAKGTGLPVYFIATRPEYLHRPGTLTDIGPLEFIALIRNAHTVVTDSYHGTLFSINFSTPFVSYAKLSSTSSTDNDRIPALLQEFGLESYFLADNDLRPLPPISWPNVHEKLKIKRASSLNYLRTILTH